MPVLVTWTKSTWGTYQTNYAPPFHWDHATTTLLSKCFQTNCNTIPTFTALSQTLFEQHPLTIGFLFELFLNLYLYHPKNENLTYRDKLQYPESMWLSVVIHIDDYQFIWATHHITKPMDRLKIKVQWNLEWLAPQFTSIMNNERADCQQFVSSDELSLD